MNFFKKQWLEEMKIWTKKTMVEEDERFNQLKMKKKKKKDFNDLVQKKICKIHCKTSILYIL